jgi:hypothetical protein
LSEIARNEVTIDAVIPLNNQVQLFVHNEDGQSEGSEVFVADPSVPFTDNDGDENEKNNQDQSNGINIGQLRNRFFFAQN